ncbi:hypothetical protein N9X61_03880 [Sulfurimonas sp.]|nr:hypothetical protein [Sulfurimonas sp.]
MNEAEKLKIYLEKIQEIATHNVEVNDIPAIQALKEAINYVEGEMIGY